MEVVRKRLVKPFQLSGRLIELDEAIGVQLGARRLLRLLLRQVGIAEPRVERSIRTDEDRVPSATRGRLQPLAGLVNDRLEAPDGGPGTSVERIDDAAAG